MKLLRISFICLAWVASLSGQDVQIQVYPLGPQGLDSNLGAAISEDGQEVTAFLQNYGASLDVFNPSSGKRSVLTGNNAFWTAASKYGTYALGSITNSTTQRYRIHIPSGTSALLPAYPLPEGASNLQTWWRWVEEDGSAIAQVGWWSAGLMTRKSVRLLPDMSGYVDVTAPDTVWNNSTQWRIKNDEPIVVEKRGASPWAHVTWRGVEHYLEPELVRDDGIGTFQLSSNGDWLVGITNNSIMRRWDLRGAIQPEPQAARGMNTSSSPGFMRVSEDGVVFGSSSYVGGTLSLEPYVWLPNGAYLGKTDLGLQNLGSGIAASAVMAMSTDRQVLAGSAKVTATAQHVFWVMRRTAPLNKEPRVSLGAKTPSGGLLFSGANLLFPVTEPGLTKTETVVVENTGEITLDDLTLELTGPGAPAFSLTRADGRTSLRPLEKITLEVTFTAPDVRGHRGELQVHSPRLATPFFFKLGGGLTPPTCTVEMPLGHTVSSLNFSPTSVGSTQTQEIFLRNTSTTLTLYDPVAEMIDFSGRTSTQFNIESPPPEVLAPGAVGSFRVRFQPTDNQTTYANLSLQPGAAAARFSPTLSTTGYVGPQPFFIVQRPDGRQAANTIRHTVSSIQSFRPVKYDFQITNKSLAPMTLTAQFGSPLMNEQVILPKNTLADGETMTVTLIPNMSFPRVLGLLPCHFYQVGGPPGSAQTPVATLELNILQATSFIPRPVLEVQDQTGAAMSSGEITIDFGETTVGLHHHASLKVRNLSNALTADWLEGTVQVAVPFSASFSRIREGQTGPLQVSFLPPQLADFSEDLRLTTNDPDHPLYIVHVRGRGIAPAAPVFVKRVESQIATLGNYVIIPTVINGGRDLTVSLNHGQRGRIAGAVWTLQTANYFEFIKVTTAQAGELRIQAQNSFGTATSEPFYLAVITPPTKTQHAMLGGNGLKLTAGLSGTQISRRWQKDGVWLEDDERRSGSTTEVLSLTSLRIEDGGDYRCEVSIPGVNGPVTQWTSVHQVLVTEKPEIQLASTLPEAVAGTVADIPVIVTKSPQTITISGLPTGVIYDSINRKIYGKIEAARGYKAGSPPFDVTITAKNAAGTTTKKTTWIVRPPHPVPVIEMPDTLPDATAQFPYSTPVVVQNSPTSVTASGLPAGLSITGGTIQGTSTKHTTSPAKVTLTAANYAGSTTKTVLLRVLPYPYEGTYEAILSRNRNVDDDLALGGRMTLTVTAAGSYTWQYQCATGITGKYTGVVTPSTTGMVIDFNRRDNSASHNTKFSWLLDFHLELGPEGLSGYLELQSFGWRGKHISGGRMMVTGVHTARPLAGQQATLAGRYTAKITHSQPPGRQWRLEGGSPDSDLGQNLPAVYENRGSVSGVTHPGSRFGSFSWAGRDGLLHLFGGTGIWSRVISAATAKGAVRADHWVFDPKSQLWSWQSGQSSGNPFPRTPTPGLSPNNFPGARTSGVSWVDGNGDFWMFGGVYSDLVSVVVYHNDLWRFVPRLKAWEQVRAISLSSFGQKGIPSATNQPPARSDACGWTDPEGNLWLFGGTTDDSISGGLGESDCWNDLWKFDIATRQWTWVSGSSSQGTQNQITAPATPGSREVPAIWPDPETGDVLLYGGHGVKQDGTATISSDQVLSDLWRWTHSTQTWSRIHENLSFPPPASPPRPPPAYLARAWRTTDGLCLLKPGPGNNAVVTRATWQFDPTTSTWTEMMPLADAAPGTDILKSPINHAGTIWQGIDGTAWFHGGYGSNLWFKDSMFSHGPARVPTAPGWLTLDVSPRGIITWAGMLGDGTPVTGSSTLSVSQLANGTVPWVIRAAPVGDFLSVQGMMRFQPPTSPGGRVTLTGDLTAVDNLRPAAQRDRSFRSGWPVHALSVNGGRYLPPASGSLVLGLAVGTNANASLAIDLPDSTTPLSLPLIVSPKSAVPARHDALISKLKLNLTSATGAYSGTATLSTPDLAKPGQQIQRAATLHGVMLESDATGLILVPDLPENFVPAKLTPIRAGEVRISPTAP